jgi:hypothetical protein
MSIIFRETTTQPDHWARFNQYIAYNPLAVKQTPEHQSVLNFPEKTSVFPAPLGLVPEALR